MTGLTLHSVEKGMARLLGQPGDLAIPGAERLGAPPLPSASQAHRTLFRQYESALRPAVEDSLEWWKGRVDVLRRREGLDPREALESAYSERITGPSANPSLVDVVRRFWLACDRLNREGGPAEGVRPEVFLLGWLERGKHDREIEVLTGMMYWPMGLDRENRWV